MLGVRQPSLGMAMQHLEAETGAILLQCDRSGVMLTSTGKVYLQIASDILSLLDAELERMQALESNDTYNLPHPADDAGSGRLRGYCAAVGMDARLARVDGYGYDPHHSTPGLGLVESIR